MVRAAAKPKKPTKPTPDFPLTPHGNGKWCKKVLGKLHYFGAWDNPQAALDSWLAQKDYLLAGRKPPTTGTEPSLRDLLQQYMVSKWNLLQSGELTQRSHDDYKAT